MAVLTQMFKKVTISFYLHSCSAANYRRCGYDVSFCLLLILFYRLKFSLLSLSFTLSENFPLLLCLRGAISLIYGVISSDLAPPALGSMKSCD